MSCAGVPHAREARSHSVELTARGAFAAKYRCHDDTFLNLEIVMLETVLLVVLVLLLVGALPSWGHSRNWGYGPSGALGVVLIVVLVLVLAGRA